MRVTLIAGGALVAAGMGLIVAFGGVARPVGALLVIWGLGTIPASMHLDRENSK